MATEKQKLEQIIHKLIMARELMPHSKRWEAARKQTLFRYLQKYREMETPSKAEEHS